MINFDGSSQGRIMGTRILCTDCHNSDDNCEFGGRGPNGPHGSKWTHILERRYKFSQVSAGALPGTTITNLFPNPDLSVNGPYGLVRQVSRPGKHSPERQLQQARFSHQLRILLFNLPYGSRNAGNVGEHLRRADGKF
jgi:hypothetical protein